jgi:probable F420-dependent oxidoreductase
VQDRCVA